jgi:hypothetical protein
LTGFIILKNKEIKLQFPEGSFFGDGGFGCCHGMYCCSAAAFIPYKRHRWAPANCPFGLAQRRNRKQQVASSDGPLALVPILTLVLAYTGMAQHATWPFIVNRLRIMPLLLPCQLPFCQTICLPGPCSYLTNRKISFIAWFVHKAR